MPVEAMAHKDTVFPMTIYKHHTEVPVDKWPWRSFKPAEIACRGTGKLLVNDRAISERRLDPDDQVKIGNSQFLYQLIP